MEKNNNNKNYLKLHIFVYDQGEVEKELLTSDDSCKKNYSHLNLQKNMRDIVISFKKGKCIYPDWGRVGRWI